MRGVALSSEMNSALRLAAPLLLLTAATWTAAADLQINFKGPTGLYSIEQWEKDWPGCGWQDGVAEGNLSLVERAGTHYLRVDYQPGEIGPEENGCGWRYPVGTRQTAELIYAVRFSPDFDWVKGGKLPGLCGGPENVSGGRPADGTNGFSARLMWRTDGRGEAYLYHVNQPGRYGDRVPFPDDFRFPSDTPVRVRMRVTMNEPGKKNGALSVWIRIGDETSATEREVVRRNDLEWRSVPTFGVDSIDFETFHGGSNKSWAPKKDSWAEFGAISLK
jgi:hypothetical protein